MFETDHAGSNAEDGLRVGLKIVHKLHPVTDRPETGRK